MCIVSLGVEKREKKRIYVDDTISNFHRRLSFHSLEHKNILHSSSSVQFSFSAIQCLGSWIKGRERINMDRITWTGCTGGDQNVCTQCETFDMHFDTLGASRDCLPLNVFFWRRNRSLCIRFYSIVARLQGIKKKTENEQLTPVATTL